MNYASRTKYGFEPPSAPALAAPNCKTVSVLMRVRCGCEFGAWGNLATITLSLSTSQLHTHTLTHTHTDMCVYSCIMCICTCVCMMYACKPVPAHAHAIPTPRREPIFRQPGCSIPSPVRGEGTLAAARVRARRITTSHCTPDVSF